MYSKRKIKTRQKTRYRKQRRNNVKNAKLKRMEKNDGGYSAEEQHQEKAAENMADKYITASNNSASNGKFRCKT